jgi:hypothetical protein
MKNQQNSELIGKYVNQRLYTDINPIGKIVGTRGKTILLVKRVVEDKQTAKMNFSVGGFGGHCINQYNQEWTFTELQEVIELRMNNQWGRRGQMYVSDKPNKFYDYNF